MVEDIKISVKVHALLSNSLPCNKDYYYVPYYVIYETDYK